jgi:hypothetical protein
MGYLCCQTCGAMVMVGDMQMHGKWHEEVGSVFEKAEYTDLQRRVAEIGKAVKELQIKVERVRMAAWKLGIKAEEL